MAEICHLIWTAPSCSRWAIAQASRVWPVTVTTKLVRVTSRTFCLFLSVSESVVSNLLARADSRPADLRRLRAVPPQAVVSEAPAQLISLWF
jgi:hypothetical protein